MIGRASGLVSWQTTDQSKSEEMGKRFEGKVAIVTASTMGIGFSIAERLGSEGASLVVSSRKQNNVDEAVQKLRRKGINVFGVVCHVSNPQQRKNLIDTTLQKYGKIDVFVSCAGVNPIANSLTNTILGTPESALDKMWEVNVKASILLLKEASPYLQKGSSIILVSSLSAYFTTPSWAMYAVTKTALIGLTKALAAELSPNTRVNCVAPGIVPTQFSKIMVENSIGKLFEGVTHLKRLGMVEEVSSVAAFLASDDASYITGETLVVAGGFPSRL